MPIRLELLVSDVIIIKVYDGVFIQTPDFLIKKYLLTINYHSTKKPFVYRRMAFLRVKKLN